MRLNKKHLAAVAVATAGAGALAAVPFAAADNNGNGPTRSYEITIENTSEGQPFTPPVVATHRGRNAIFKVGRPASEGVKQIAENGNPAALLAQLGANPRVSDVYEGSAPLVPGALPGSATFDDAVTFTIEADRGHRRLSWQSMLICTNDGFTGLNSLRLPRGIGHTTVASAQGYDAGTEANTEDFGDIVPPCQGLSGVTGDPGTGESDPALATNFRISHHPGITGRRDLLTDVHGFTNPVAKVTVTRVS